MPADPETFEPYRTLLFSIAYRMLGSAMEAEDMVQEAYLRYEKAEDVQSPKGFLTTVITRLCLDYLKSAKTQREDYVGTWLPEPLLTDESPGAKVSERESISMAFLVLLENLSPVERAVFLLRDVFEYSYAEISQMVGKSEVNCRRYYHRAKQYLMERRPRFEPSTTEQDKLVEGFMQAISTGDLDSLTHMLADDVILYGDGGGKAPAVRQPLVGREAVMRLMTTIYRMMPPDTRIEKAEVNGALSLLFWGRDQLYFVMNFVVADNHVTRVHNILNPDKLLYIQQHGPSSLEGSEDQA